MAEVMPLAATTAYRIFVVAASGDLTIQNTTLTQGKADDDGPLCVEGLSWTSKAGGAICNRGNLSVKHSRFSANFAGGFGGAIANLEGGEASISDSRFFGNYSDYGFGGAIDNSEGGEISITNSLFSENSAFGGGAIANGGGVISIRGSSFYRNAAGRRGGAFGSFGEASISDSSFYGNSAESKGGAIANEGVARISHVTIADNSSELAGGLFVADVPDSVVYLRNSILTNNAGGDCVIEKELAESLQQPDSRQHLPGRDRSAWRCRARRLGRTGGWLAGLFPAAGGQPRN